MIDNVRIVDHEGRSGFFHCSKFVLLLVLLSSERCGRSFFLLTLLVCETIDFLAIDQDEKIDSLYASRGWRRDALQRWGSST